MNSFCRSLVVEGLVREWEDLMGWVEDEGWPNT